MTKGLDDMKLSFIRMDAGRRDQTFALMRAFLRHDAHYLDSSAAYGDGGDEALHCALDLFLKMPEAGFVWLALAGEEIVAACVVCHAISTSRGTLVAKLDDVNVKPGLEGKGTGTAMLNALKHELTAHGITRIDTATHFDNPEARRFYEKLGFVTLREERLSCLL
jgi:GNAT superfamily N-acetyltransferase